MKLQEGEEAVKTITSGGTQRFTLSVLHARGD